MSLKIKNPTYWEIPAGSLLESRWRFGTHPLVTKFVYQPDGEILVMGCGRQAPSHKALMSAAAGKAGTDTSCWVRGVILRDRRLIYYRQGVRNPLWYQMTTEMLRSHGLPRDYDIVWGEEAKRALKEALEDYP